MFYIGFGHKFGTNNLGITFEVTSNSDQYDQLHRLTISTERSDKYSPFICGKVSKDDLLLVREIIDKAIEESNHDK